MSLRIIPEGLAAASAEVAALTAQLAAAQASAAPIIAGVVPPAVDPVSVQAVAEFNALNQEYTIVGPQGVEELGRAGLGVAECGTSYAVDDAQAAAAYWVTGG